MPLAEDGRVAIPGPIQEFLSLRRDVLVLSVAMFAFSLGFQMTGRYLPEYLRVLGASAGVIGLYGSAVNLLGAVYPYPGGVLSDRIGSRYALTGFAVMTTIGFGLWLLAPTLGGLRLGPVTVPAWAWIFLGLGLAQAWKSLGLGATFAIVKQSVTPDALATGFATTETVRRIGFLVGPLAAAGILAATGGFVRGFQGVILLALGFGAVATIAQATLYDPGDDSIGTRFAGLAAILGDLRSMPSPLRPLLVADTLVRFANGMVYVFFVIVVTDFLAVGVTAFGVALQPDAFFGLLLGVEMVVALLIMAPAAKLAERVGLKPVVALGFAVYGAFPALLITAPPSAGVLTLLFALSGVRFAGLPAHKALIVGPADLDAGGRVTGTYYLVRNTVVIPSAAIGGVLYGIDPRIAFGVASTIGLVGTAYFLVAGREPVIRTAAYS